MSLRKEGDGVGSPRGKPWMGRTVPGPLGHRISQPTKVFQRMSVTQHALTPARGGEIPLSGRWARW
jgi:hypothetical protein